MQNKPYFCIEHVGEFSILLRFSSQITPSLPITIQQVATVIQHHFQDSLHQLVPSYTTLLLEFDPLRFESDTITWQISKLLCPDNSTLATPIPTRVIEVPTYYGLETGLDLNLYQGNGLAVDDVIRLHTSIDYLVYALGFTPGFAFMAEVATDLQMPRNPTPRPYVAAGSVAIAANQTAIYPSASPGGWNIIGKTPLSLYQPKHQNPCLLKVGDKVRFTSISKSDFLLMGGVI
ncbi:5-oxoprolinase subunit PxpB [Vibrio gallicus]|uniref:5-oxoprolinase subunit PxpB n=1 Tax=Vibrio gallicus TaxID=190897 RepID=UPI0021C28CE4|nr:5-oxoprolinase subunit PxpB [Vibrio gallicus]